jgi:hypothetical protein
MSGFVASARVTPGRPRLTRIDRALLAPRAEAAAGSRDEGIVILEASQPAAGPRAALTERWQAIRERWSQTTFYLFDPNAWR